MNFTFGIVSNGKEYAYLNNCIESIHNQKIRNYEIIIDYQSEISREWQGFVEILNPEKSSLAKEMGIKTPGRYALRVR